MPDWLDPSVLQTFRLGLLGQLILATILGGIIGLEREISGKPAGLRTNILICVGATLLMDVSLAVASSGIGGSADPGRIAAQVVSGIGFIGAGTILVARGEVVGLTTAATIWVVAAIGLAIGSHAYVEAIGTTLLVATTLVMLGWIEDYIGPRRRAVQLQLITDPDADVLDAVARLFEKHRLKARPTDVEKAVDHYRASYQLVGPRARRDAALHDLAAADGVRKITVL